MWRCVPRWRGGVQNAPRRTDSSQQHGGTGDRSWGDGRALIHRYRRRTNLLALNATSEAARAGECKRLRRGPPRCERSGDHRPPEATEDIRGSCCRHPNRDAELPSLWRFRDCRHRDRRSRGQVATATIAARRWRQLLRHLEIAAGVRPVTWPRRTAHRSNAELSTIADIPTNRDRARCCGADEVSGCVNSTLRDEVNAVPGSDGAMPMRRSVVFKRAYPGKRHGRHIAYGGSQPMYGRDVDMSRGGVALRSDGCSMAALRFKDQPAGPPIGVITARVCCVHRGMLGGWPFRQDSVCCGVVDH